MSVQVGEIVEGKVTDVVNYGVFVKLSDDKSGLVHISEVSRDYIEDIHSVIKIGDIVKVKVLSIDNGKISLSIKKALPMEERPRKNNSRERSPQQPVGPLTLDDMLSRFMKDSDERQLDLKRNIESKRRSSKRRM